MFRSLFEQCMKNEPETVDQKYIFIVDSSDIALSRLAPEHRRNRKLLQRVPAGSE